jgi:hypothetical protein
MWRALAPTNLSDAIFLLLFICAIVFHPLAWWRLIKAMPSLTSSQTETTFLGLLANLVALVFPFVYAFSSIFTLSLQRAIRWDYVLVGCWVLCALSLVLSLLGPKQVRLPLLLSSLAVAVFWTMVPIGIL